jgi:hypothetical protein
MRFVFVTADEIARISALETGVEVASDIRKPTFHESVVHDADFTISDA